MLEAEAFKALSKLELVQVVVSILIVITWSWGVYRARQEKTAEKKPSNGSNGVPAWTLYGPVRDLMQVIHDMAEQSREGNRTLSRIEETVKDIAKEQREGTMLLENIRNNQEMRGDLTIPPPAPRRKSI